MSKGNRKKRNTRRLRKKQNTAPVATGVKNDLVTEKKEQKIDNKGDGRSFFYDILILIVSLLHGTLFFLLAEKAIELINDYSIEKMSYLALYFSIFLRIFQTHILAAVKYTEKWLFKPMDFVMVFFTALFEYVLFNNDKISVGRDEWHYYTLFVFCLFGVIGYLITYLRTYKDYKRKERSTELGIQSINIFCILVVGIVKLLCYLKIWPEFLDVVMANFVSAGVLIVNIYLSLKLSKNQINSLIKTG